MQQLSQEQQTYNKEIEQQYVIDMKERNNPKNLKEQRLELSSKIILFMTDVLHINTLELLNVNHLVWKQLKI